MIETMMQISLTLVAFDKMSKVITESVNKSDIAFKQLQTRIQDVSKNLEKFGKAATVAGGVFTAMSAANLRAAATFEDNMANVSTLIDTNIENFDAMKKEVLDIAKRTPVALDGLTSALYDIRSAGISADMQFQVLERSAQLGMAGLGSTSEAVDLVTSSLNAFQLEGEKAEKVYDTIFKTVKFGKTTISGIAQGFGSVAGTVAAAGIQLDDYLAAVAALTTTGQPAAQAHHQLKAAIAGMTRESDDAVEVFKALGVKNFKELIQKSGGMVNAFKSITDKVKGNDAAILSLFGSTMAYNAVVGLTTKQSQSYIDTLDSMRNGASLVDEGYAKKLDTVNAQMQRFQNFAQKIRIDFGNAIAPMFRDFLDRMQVVMDYLDKLPDETKSKIAVTILGLGVGLTGIGLASLAMSKIVAGYGQALGVIRNVAPKIKFAFGSIFQAMRLREFNINFLNGKGDLFGAFVRDIVKLDTAMRGSIKKSFGIFVANMKNLPSNIVSTVNAFKDWISVTIKGLPTAFLNGLNALKNGFLGIPNMIKNAVIAFRTFSLTLLTSPVGWIAVAIGTAALLIYKYWKPITAFFRGVWQGLREGLQPLMPLFKRIAEAISPILTPIKALIDWIKKIIKPVEDTGGAAEKMGVKFGKAIADIIVKFTELITKVFEFGKKIGDMLADGILSKKGRTQNAIEQHAQIVRDHLPHSPAKTGPLKDLHKVKIIETVADTMKPQPLVTAMNKSLEVISNPSFKATPKFNLNPIQQLKVIPKTPVIMTTTSIKQKQTQKEELQKRANQTNSSTVINYNPTIYLSGKESKEEFNQLLKQHKNDILRLVREEEARKERVKY